MVATIAIERDSSTAVYDEVLAARQPWSRVIKKGQTLRIIDLQANQAVDTLFYNAHDPSERYSAPDTVVRQGNIFYYHRNSTAFQ